MSETKAITYTESREAFFVKKLKKAERGLDNLVKYGTDPDDCAKSGEEVAFYQDALAALRAEEEMEKGCVFCGEERHRIREMFDDGTARILCSMNHYALSVETPADATSESIFPIYFCPMCGRKLDGGGQDGR